jgi:hypothetical protein
MKRKKYEEPMTSVVVLEQCASLLQASGGVDATMDETFTEEDI